MSYSKKDLYKKAEGVFKLNPDADYLLATRDGQFFLPGKENAAQLHAKEAGDREPLKIYEINKREVVKPESSAPSKKDDGGEKLSLVSVKGIGKKTAEGLREHDIDSLEKLANISDEDVKVVADAVDSLTEADLKKYSESAGELLKQEEE